MRPRGVRPRGESLTRAASGRGVIKSRQMRAGAAGPRGGGGGRERRPTGEAAPRPEVWPLDEVLQAAVEVEGLVLDELPVVAEEEKAPEVLPLDERPAAEEEDPDIELAVL